MARYTKNPSVGGGTFYIKTMGGIEVPADGLPYTAFAKAIPPFIAVNRAWVNVWLTGKNSSGLHDKQQMLITGQFSNINLDMDSTSEPAHNDGLGEGGTAGQKSLNGFVDTHQPIASGDHNVWDEHSNEEDVGLGITSHDPDTEEATQISDAARTREFMSAGGPYKVIFGLGKNSFMDGAASMRYHHHINKGGKSGFSPANPGLDITKWRLFSLRGWTDSISNHVEQDDWHHHTFGADEPDIDGLTDEAHKFFGVQGVGAHHNESTTTLANQWTPAGIRMGVDEDDTISPYNFQPWLRSGWGTSGANDGTALGGSGLDVDNPIMMQTKVTLECAVLKPRPMNIYSPDG